MKKAIIALLIVGTAMLFSCSKEDAPKVEPSEPMRKVTYNVQCRSDNCHIMYSTWEAGARKWVSLDSVPGDLLHTFYIPTSLVLTDTNRLQIYAEDNGWTKQFVFVLISINDTAYRPAGLEGRANAVYPP